MAKTFHIEELIRKFDKTSPISTANKVEVNTSILLRSSKQETSKIFVEDSDTSDDSFEFEENDNADEKIFGVADFLQDEEEFCLILEDLVKNYVKAVFTTKFDVLEVFGRIDLLYSYQRNSFLPDLTHSCDSMAIVKCFIKHQKLFNTHYNDYFMNLPNMILVVNENKDVFKEPFSEEIYKDRERILINGLSDRIKKYQSFLETAKMNSSNRSDSALILRAITIIENLTQKAHLQNTVSFVISEIVETERFYLNKLQFITEDILPVIKKYFKHTSKQNSILGVTTQIFLNQQEIYQDFKKCLFDFNPNEIADCFLQHRDQFLLYIEDNRLKNNYGVIDELETILPKNLSKSFDIYASLNRLYKYKLLLQALQKAVNKQGLQCEKVQEALVFIDDLINKINDNAAINCIRDENIYIDYHGKLLKRDTFQVEEETVSYEGVVFLFEKAVVFTEKTIEGNEKSLHDIYVYKNHIISKYLALNVLERHKNRFQLEYHGKNKRVPFVLTSADTDIANNWITAISVIIRKQFMVDEKNPRL